jgi:hypothetical protein
VNRVQLLMPLVGAGAKSNAGPRRRAGVGVRQDPRACLCAWTTVNRAARGRRGDCFRPGTLIAQPLLRAVTEDPGVVVFLSDVLGFGQRPSGQGRWNRLPMRAWWARNTPVFFAAVDAVELEKFGAGVGPRLRIPGARGTPAPGRPPGRGVRLLRCDHGRRSSPWAWSRCSPLRTPGSGRSWNGKTLIESSTWVLLLGKWAARTRALAPRRDRGL